MPDERVLDLRGRDVVAGHEHHVVDAPEQPEVALLVALGAVAREVLASEARPVGVAVALLVAPDPAQHRGPRLREHEVTATRHADGIARVVDDVGADAWDRERRAAWLQRGEPRHG